ncbi:DUF3566 domain-containing protein [Rhodococcus sp. HM1]|uniref:DUF3566 domain-containing protein n=1 Tax=Rhodococcus sp. HM1 TaxID=2937759 RepID=UPI00200ABDA5|nr:DUF3566 domain-containing protein [Rhodococcus sp. HM1]MCK8672168.1 DUF3566 domain-containing protein [Rhodococcus sp. HM1]
MSTPQGPNGADKGSPAPKGPNGQETANAPVKPDAAKPSSAEAPSAASAPAAPKSPDAPKAPAGPAAQAAAKPEPSEPSDPPPTGADKPATGADKPAAGADKPAAGAADKPAPNPTAQTTPTVRRAADKGVNPAQSGAQRPAAAGQVPPWQRGQQTPAAHQNTPQTNLPGRGQGVDRAVTGNAAPQRASAQPASARPQSAPTPPTRPVVTGTAAASLTGGADRTSVKAKSAIIDGPTRHIERKDLAKDLPDLSTVKHPLPASAPGAGEASAGAPAASSATDVTAAVPMAGEPLRATVQVRRIDPWSMLKISSVISLSLFFVWMVAVGLLYGILAGMGVWERLNSAFTDIVSESGSGGLISAGQVFGYATVIGLANTILLTAMATLGAFIYNLCTDLVGGVQVTLADPD